MDREFTQYAVGLLDRAAALEEHAFLQFSRLASRFFPPFFGALGFLPEESERMTLTSIDRIERDLGNYVAKGRANFEAWLSEHLNAVTRLAVVRMREAEDELNETAARQSEVLYLASMDGIETHARYRPARRISGDFCEGVTAPDGSYFLAVGDASGKGGAAAFFSMLCLGLVRASVGEVSDPAELLRLINRRLYSRNSTDAYVTLVLARWQPSDRVLTLSSAGGCVPITITSSGVRFRRLQGNWLGTFPEIDLDSMAIRLEAGESLAIYSDGVPDQHSELDLDETFGTDKLLETITRSRDQAPRGIVTAVFSDLDAFRGAAPVFDDQTVVVARFL